MHLLWPIIRKTALYYWDELLYLSIFNFVLFVGIVPLSGMLVTSVTQVPLLVLAPVFVLLFLIAPYLLFSLFWVVYEIGEGKAIKLATFFGGGRMFLKQAYLWAAVNVLASVILFSNLYFYATLETAWSTYLTFLFMGITVMWYMVQLYALSLYPRLVNPTLKEALKNALALVGSYPVLTLVIGLLCLAFLVAGIIPLIIAILSFSAIAMLTNATTEAVIKDIRLKRGEAEEAKKTSEISEWRLDD